MGVKEAITQLKIIATNDEREAKIISKQIEAIDMGIDALKTQIDLVRCGECKWCEEEWDSNNNCPTWECKNWFGGTDYDGYCHEGERRVDDKEIL